MAKVELEKLSEKHRRSRPIGPGDARAPASGILVSMASDLPTTGGMPILLLLVGVVILGAGVLLYVLLRRGGGAS